MHELSIAMSLIDTATEEAQRLGATAVRAIHLRIGPLSGVVTGALESAFGMARENTALAGARLVVESTGITAYCEVCGGVRPVESLQCVRCVDCGAWTPDIRTGRELEVIGMEIVT
jgi:hydrogenase nickel incorporation protein HypA/HybF